MTLIHWLFVGRFPIGPMDEAPLPCVDLIVADVQQAVAGLPGAQVIGDRLQLADLPPIAISPFVRLPCTGTPHRRLILEVALRLVEMRGCTAFMTEEWVSAASLRSLLRSETNEVPPDWESVVSALGKVMSWAVRQDGMALARIASYPSPEPEHIRAAFDNYRWKPVLPGDDHYHHADFVEVDGSIPRRWSVWLPLFTTEEGKSDLTMMLTLIADPDQGYVVEFDDVRVP